LPGRVGWFLADERPSRRMSPGRFTEKFMKQIQKVIRWMTYLNVGATLALLAWLASHLSNTGVV
jgi:hypothetical protein